MRIDIIKQTEQVYNGGAFKQDIRKVTSKQRDQIEISGMGRDLQIAKKAVKEASDIREDKVNDIKQRMKSGTYHVSSMEVAEKIVDSYFDTLI